MLLLQGVFRSGTTALFRALRQDGTLRGFYEPLHPNLLSHIRESRSAQPDHPKSSLYAEYTPLCEQLRAHLGPEGPPQYRALGEEDGAHVLRRYLHLLDDTAAEVLLQFNRAFWMVSWLAQTFPDGSFVHLVRDPRSVVWSQLTTASGERVRMDWPVLGRLIPFSSGALRRVFSKHAYFGAYHLDEYLEAGRRLLHDAPPDGPTTQALRRLEAACGAVPYVKALALWGAQVELCHCHARSAFGDQYRLLRYEAFCEAPCEHLRSVYALQDRSLPDPVCEHARSSIDADRLRRWTDVTGAEQRFQEGIHRAQIADLMRDLGYDPSCESR